MYFLRSPDTATVQRISLRPLLVKEVAELLSGRALWTMLLMLCPLVGYSFFQAVALYGEASAAARDQPVLATSLSPLDGILVPTFGAFYVAVTLLFPFVAIRALGREKETGALKLLVQLPYQIRTLAAAKLTAISIAWLIAVIPVATALLLWLSFGGHLNPLETLNLFLGHLLYGLLIGAIALFAAAISESSATAAIVTLSFTIGSWVLDFALAGQSGTLGWISRLSLTQALRTFEQGLFSAAVVLGMFAAIAGFAAMAAIWLHPGTSLHRRLARTILCVGLAGTLLAVATQLRRSCDVSEDKRNSFPAADQRALAGLKEPLIITVHLAPEDPRYVDLQRNVLSKLERIVPNVTIRLVTAGQSVIGSAGEESYGEIEYSYGGHLAKSRSTSHREALPLLYGLAGMPVPTPQPGEDYPGYPLVADGWIALPWFFVALPLLFAVTWWWWSHRAPDIPVQFVKKNGGQL
jgi:ABC-type transport system involved in multi-copper enzyme maturation permease subunit